LLTDVAFATLRTTRQNASRWADSEMARAPFQVIVIPFLKAASSEPRYGIFKRRTHEMWQAISGGGEDIETPLEAAIRETLEETGVAGRNGWVCLQSRASVPASAFSGTDHWPRDLFVVPEYAFGLAVSDTNVELSAEHSECAWLPFHKAHQRLTWDSNRVALWELHCRIQGLPPRETADPALVHRAGTAQRSSVLGSTESSEPSERELGRR
jgi:dATP pyrophosphohydrolase